MFTCKSCGLDKEYDEFYKHPKASSGIDSTCKECRKEKIRENRAKKIEYYRNYDRERFKNDPRVKERHKKYQETDAGKEKLREAKKRFIAKNPVKRAAHVILGNAVRDGRIIKPARCDECKSTGRIHGHHDDYSMPLVVRWLCPKCHKKWHDENGEGING